MWNHDVETRPRYACTKKRLGETRAIQTGNLDTRWMKNGGKLTYLRETFFKRLIRLEFPIFMPYDPASFYLAFYNTQPHWDIFWYRFHLGESDAKIYPIESVPKPH